jgi:putative toxin-antitoxin system antitoxin component (TIGR02293 family)
MKASNSKKSVLQESAMAYGNSLGRIEIIRKGLPYSTIDELSERMQRPIKFLLGILGIAQTTYNLNKRQEADLNSKESELVVAISELLSFGQEVFNNEEEKFNRWLEMPNQSLNGITPQSLFDTLSGVAEVRKCLNRIEYGNFA